jgi:hypothetical protein
MEDEMTPLEKEMVEVLMVAVFYLGEDGHYEAMNRALAVIAKAKGNAQWTPRSTPTS